MQKIYKNTGDFLDDLHKENLKEMIIEMGYVEESHFHPGSKIHCIFHDGDKTPSLQITESFFKCYGCDAKGDIIQWVMLYDNLSFVEAIKKIASFYDIKIEEIGILNVNPMYAKLAAEWKQYLENYEKYKMDKQVYEMAKRFAPFEVGYDIKLNYIVLPIKSKLGKVLGFVKRRVSNDENQQRYLNSTLNDSLIGECHGLFNLDDAIKHKKKCKNEIYVVEGAADVASIKRNGIQNVVGLCGSTKCSYKTLSILQPIEKLILCLDNDKAGIKSTKSAILDIALNNSKIIENIFVKELPEGMDPGDVENIESCRNIPAIEWFVDTTTIEESVQLYNNCKSNIVLPLIRYQICKKYGYSNIMFEEIIEGKNIKQNDSIDIYKERLLATLGKCQNINIEPFNMTPIQATKILKMRYGIVMEGY